MTRTATGVVESCVFCNGCGRNEYDNPCEMCDGRGEVDVLDDDDDDGSDDDV